MVRRISTDSIRQPWTFTPSDFGHLPSSLLPSTLSIEPPNGTREGRNPGRLYIPPTGPNGDRSRDPRGPQIGRLSEPGDRDSQEGLARGRSDN
jgi:hypothetical protein